MTVEQVYGLVNTITTNVLGQSNVAVAEDLTNVVDVGTAIFNQNAMDNYVRSLVNHIGKVVFTNRVYKGKLPSLLMDNWEFGSVLQKVSSDLYTASENNTWDLQDGQTYDQNVFYKPKISAKFFNSKVTFEIPISITERQVKESFSSADQLNAFISMIYTAIENSMTVKVEGLIMRAINNMISITKNDGSNTRLVNLLTLYNTAKQTTLTSDTALYDPDFLKFAVKQITMYKDRLNTISTLFNIGGTPKFTPDNQLVTILHSEFEKSAEVYLYSQTFNQERVLLPQTETVPFWQASGDNFSFDKTSTITITDSKGNLTNLSYIIGVMFDRNAVAVCNTDRRVTTNYNAKGEFFNNYFKYDCQLFNDENENFVVFTLN